MTPSGKLIDQLQVLKDTKDSRAVERENERIKAEQEDRLRYIRYGSQQAVDAFPTFTRQILTVAERDDATDYEIQVQTTSREYNLDEYDAAYAEKLAQLLRDEGLGVEWVRTTQEPGQGSYYSFSEARYNTVLKVTW